jgi:molecular chaperone DnaK (HSP70)
LFAEEKTDKLGQSSIAINPNTIKYVIFIDVGHSKTTFILSEFRPAFFRVVNCISDPFLGGRDIDLIIFDHLNKIFMSKHHIDISKYKKSKIRLIEQITKARKVLTGNQETSISVDSLVDDYDFQYLLTRKDMLEIIKPCTSKFQAMFESFYKISVDNIDKAISFIEMAGDCMRMPILQQIVTEVSKKELSKSVMIDECVSKGCALYSASMNDMLKSLQMFNGIYHWNPFTILYSIDHVNSITLINKSEPIPIRKTIELDLKNLDKDILSISFYYSKLETQTILNEGNLLFEYDFILGNLVKENPKINGKKISIEVLIDNSGNVHIQNMKCEEENIKISQNALTLKSGIIKSNSAKTEFLNTYISLEKQHMEKDDYIKRISNLRNQIEADLYKLGDKIDQHKSDEIETSGRNLFQRLDSIDESIQKGENVDDKISRVEKALYKKTTSKIPGNKDDNINSFKKDISFSEFNNLVKYYRDVLDSEYAQILGASRSRLSEQTIKLAHEILQKYVMLSQNCYNETELGTHYQNLQKEMKKWNI